MIPEIVFFVALGILILVVVLFIRSKVIDFKIAKASRKIALLRDLNRETIFNRVRERIEYRKHYDNKRSYLKIKPGYLMASVLRDNIGEYSSIIENIKENRELLMRYNSRVSQIMIKDMPNSYKDFKISLESYKRRERKIAKRMFLKPVTDIRFCVRMSYSSPKGQVNLSKSDCFNYEDMVTSFNSISRTYLDKETRKILNTTVRGNLSDSLRFDILQRDDYKCVICGSSSREGARLHVDHIVPVSKGGKSNYDNLQTLCERCNVGKSNKLDGRKEDLKLSDKGDVCPRCNSSLVKRKGRHGEFLGCSDYPRCKYTKNITT